MTSVIEKDEEGRNTSPPVSNVDTTKAFLTDSGLGSLPRSLTQDVFHLEELHLDNNQITDITCALPPNLTWLSLHNNHLQTIPEAVGQLTCLRILSVGKNPKIKHVERSLQEALKNLQSLTELYIHDMNLSRLPQTLPKKLHILDAAYNHLTNISPPTFQDLCNLRILYLSNNQFTHFDVTIPSLTLLNLTDNRLTFFPEYLGEFQLLTEFRLYNNQLLEVPQSVLCLTTLTELHLHDNCVETVTTLLLSRLINLKLLDLRNNKLREFHQVNTENSTLTSLDLRGNRLRQFPECFPLPKLYKLDLRWNKLNTTPIPQKYDMQFQSCNTLVYL